MATIYGTPITLSALAFNILMGMSGGIIGAWVYTRDPFWMMSGALAGIIATASGLDIYWPGLAFVVGMGAGLLLAPAAGVLDRMGIDDAVGAVTVHGTIGIYGMLALGIFGAGYPALQGAAGDAPTVSFVGQLVGSIVFIAIGLGTGWITAGILKVFGLLRVPADAEEHGLDPVKVASSAYPEGIPISAPPQAARA